MADIMVAVPQQRVWQRAVEGITAQWPQVPVRTAAPLWRHNGQIEPDIEPGERVYLVWQGLLRGWAPLVSWYRTADGRQLRFRLAAAEWQPCSLEWDYPVSERGGFRQGWRYVQWTRPCLHPFPGWATATVLPMTVVQQQRVPQMAVAR